MGEDLSLIAAIADDLPAGVWVASAPDGRFVYSNRAFAQIMGMGPEQDVAVGGYAGPYGIYDRAGRLYPEDQMPFVRALRTGTTVVVDDIVIHRRDGQRVYVRAVAKPIREATGETTRVIIAFFDISAEVAANERRDVMENELQTVLDHAPVIVFLTDEHGVINLAQGRGLARLGDEILVGASMLTSYPALPVVADAARRALAGEDVRFVVSNELGVFETWVAPLHDAEGRTSGVIGVSMDVTDRHNAEEQLAQAERLASLGLLAAGVAHEVNNPLAYVVTNLELAQRELAAHGAALPPEARATLERALADTRDGASRVTALVKDLKLFARVGERLPRDVDVRTALGTALGLAHNETRHRARVVRDLGAVPLVRADEGRLTQLFLNLVVNAAQAIREGAAEQHEIRVRTFTTDAGFAAVEVRDTGTGMDEETRRRVFDPFFTTKDPGAGTGLGLAICHSIATSLGGRIEVDSALGTGSTFRVLLPQAAALPASDVAPRTEVTSSIPPRGTPPAAGARARVLLLDDEPLIVRAVAPLLDGEYDVVTETRADAALQRIAAGERFDVIVCDLMMPEMTGMDLHAALETLAPDQARRMLFVTGGVFTESAASFLERMRTPPIEKPFDAETLLQRVRAVVLRRRA